MRHPQFASVLIPPSEAHPRTRERQAYIDANTYAQRILGPVPRYQANKQSTSP